MVGGEPTADLGQHDAMGVLVWTVAVAWQRSTACAQPGAVPVMGTGPFPYRGAGGGSVWPSVARTRSTPCRWRPWKCRSIAASARNRSNAGEVSSLSIGLRLSSSSNVQIIDSRFAARYPHSLSTANRLDRPLDGGGTENPLRQRLPRERPDQIECGEPGEQIGMNEQIGTCLHADLPRETLPQLLWAQQLGPHLCRPGPEVAAQLAAAVRDDRAGGAGEPSLEHGVGMPVRHGERLVQWRGQPRNRLPLPVFTVPVEPQQVETKSLQRIGLVLRQPFMAPETIQP